MSDTAIDAREVKTNMPRAPLQKCPHIETGEQDKEMRVRDKMGAGQAKNKVPGEPWY